MNQLANAIPKTYRRMRDSNYPIKDTPSVREVLRSPFRDYLFDSEAESAMRFYKLTHKQVMEVLKTPTRTESVTSETKLSILETRKYRINVYHQPQYDEDEKNRDNPRIVDTIVVGVGVLEL